MTVLFKAMVVLGLAALWPLVALAENRVLRVAGFEAAPYLYLDDTDEPAGLLVDVMTAASETSAVPVEYLVTSWPRAQLEVRQGRADLIFPVVYTPERETWLDYPKTPITRFEMMIFARSDAPFKFTGHAEELHGLTIGKIAGGRMHPNFRELEDSGEARVEGRENLRELILGTHLKRLDAFIAPHLMGLWSMEREGITTVAPFKVPMGVSGIYLAASKQSPNKDLWLKLQQHLPTLREARQDFLADLAPPQP